MISALDLPLMTEASQKTDVLLETLPPDSPRGRGRTSPGGRLAPRVAAFVVLLGFPGLSHGQVIDPAVRNRVQDATVFIKIKAGQMQGSGSGFVMKVTGADSVLIMTNRHVAAPDPAELPRGARAELSVVFRSGTAQEQELPARVLAYDGRDVRDLAVLEVRGVRSPPSPIPADATAKEADLFLAMPVFALGFPLGGAMQQVAGDRLGNPSLTLNTMTISALRLDQDRVNLEKIQLNGAVIGGNSGGPLVDAQGRLVGVVVARIRGENVGFAIPPGVIAAFLAGDIGEILHAELIGALGPNTQLKLTLRLVDPLNRLRGVSIRYARQADPAASAAVAGVRPQPGRGYPELPGGTSVPLTLKDGTATGTFALPIKDPGDRKVLLQFLVSDSSGRAIVSTKPIAATLPERPGIIAGLDSESRPPALAKWSCETNLDVGIKMTHGPGSTTIELPASVPLNNAPQYKLLNAPCALVKVEGDFTASVQVEDTFDPGGEGISVPTTPPKKLPFSFRSAGILIWQDKDNFIRLERSKGSDGKISMVNRVLVEVYKNGKTAAVHYIDVPEVPIALVAIRKGGSLQLLFAMPPKQLAVFKEMAIDLDRDVFVGVAAANLSKRPFQAKLANFKLKNLSGQDVEVKPVDMPNLVDPGFRKLPDGTRVFEGADLKVYRPDRAPVAAQTMDQSKGEWSNNRQLLWNNDKADGTLVLDLPVDVGGKYEIRARFTTAPDYAIANFAIDGKTLYQGGRVDDYGGKINFYSPRTEPAKETSFGALPLDKGKHKLTITVSNKDKKSAGYRFGLDEIRLVPAR